jgi:FkbM family methyltransferase
MKYCTFTNDDDVTILLTNHNFSNIFKNRDNHEIMFRRINTYLIKNKFIKNNIIDLGAWIGDNSIPWAKNIDGIVYAIDPSHENCEFINKTCEINQIKNVKTIECAISNINEALSTNDNLNHCSFINGNPGLSGINKVYAVSLDYLYEKKLIDNIGYIHLDVEGMEYKVINGSINLIDECRPIISFEQHLETDDYDIISSHLKNKDYSIFLINEILPGCRDDCRNSFAFPNELFNETLIENIHNYIGQNILISK